MQISQPVPGAPEHPETRIPAEQAAYRLLQELSVPFLRVDHEEAATLEDCRNVDLVLNTRICKNLFLCNRQKTAFYLLLMDGNKPFKTKYLSAQIQSSRLSFASPEDMMELLNVTPGSASVLALMNDVNSCVQLLIDRPVIERDTIGCHPCKNTSSLRLRTKDVMEVILPHLKHEARIVDLPDEVTE